MALLAVCLATLVSLSLAPAPIRAPSAAPANPTAAKQPRTRVRAHQDDRGAQADDQPIGEPAAAGPVPDDIVLGHSWCAGSILDESGTPLGRTAVVEIQDENRNVLTWSPVGEQGRFAFLGNPAATNPADAADVRIVARYESGETAFRTLARDVRVRLPEDWFCRNDLRLQIPAEAAEWNPWELRVVWRDDRPAQGLVVAPLGGRARIGGPAAVVSERGTVRLSRYAASVPALGVSWATTPGDPPFHAFDPAEVVGGLVVLPTIAPPTVRCRVVGSSGIVLAGVGVVIRCGSERRLQETGPDGSVSFPAHPRGEEHRLEHSGSAPLTRDGTASDGAEVWVLEGGETPNVTFRFRTTSGCVASWRRFEGVAGRSVVADAWAPEANIWLPPGQRFSLHGTFTFADAPAHDASVRFTVAAEGPTIVDVIAGEQPWPHGDGSTPYLLVDLGIEYFDGTVPSAVTVATEPAGRYGQPTRALSPSDGWTTPTAAGRFMTWIPLDDPVHRLFVRSPLGVGLFGPYALDRSRRLLRLDLRLPRPDAYVGRLTDISGAPVAHSAVAYAPGGRGVPRWDEYEEAPTSSDGLWLIPFFDAPDTLDLWAIEDRLEPAGGVTRILHSLARNVPADETAGMLELFVRGW